MTLIVYLNSSVSAALLLGEGLSVAVQHVFILAEVFVLSVILRGH